MPRYHHEKVPACKKPSERPKSVPASRRSVAIRTTAVSKNRARRKETGASVISPEVQEIIRRIEKGEELHIPRIRLAGADDVVLLMKMGAGLGPLMIRNGVQLSGVGSYAQLAELEDGWYSVTYYPVRPEDVPPDRDKAFPLKCEPIPEGAWYQNLRKLLPRVEWDRLRRQVYAQHNHTCGICGVGGRMNCHEVWDIDEANCVLRLKGFVALCDLCHHVKHIGLAESLDRQGKIDLHHVVEHFRKVNLCTLAEFEAHKNRELKQWRKRSTHKWTVDFGPYAPEK